MTRLRILHLLLIHKDGLYVCEIVNTLQLQQYNISKHLNNLKTSNLVDEEKNGKMVLYRANFVKENKDFFSSVLTTVDLERGIFDEDKMNLKKVLDLRVNNECVITYK